MSSNPARPLRALLLSFVALLATVAVTAAPAQAQPRPDVAALAARLAERLRENPVHITDQLPRAVPRSTAPEFAALARRTGVPTYVMVLPGSGSGGDAELLAAVHDRLKRDGLYVLLDDVSVRDAAAFGVRAPTEDALTVTTYELPYDAGPLRAMERFVEVIAQGSAKAAERADAARARYGGDDDPPAMYIGPSDRENQSFVTGIALTAVPLSLLGVAWYVRRWRRGLPLTVRVATRSGGRWYLAPALAVVSAGAIALTATLLFDQTRSSAAPAPTAADLSARVERVAAGLAKDPVYQDPESPRMLDDARAAALRERVRAFAGSAGGGPVYIALVPQTSEDESAGDSDLFAASVRERLGKDGVYVVADPGSGFIDVFNHGLRLDGDRLAYDLPESIAYGDDAADEADDHLLGERLDRLMTYLDDSPRTAEPETPLDPAPAPDPVAETTLRPLFSGDFLPGLLMGALGAGTLLALVAGGLGIAGAVLRRRHPEPLPTELLPYTAPSEPSMTYLHLVARSELVTLTRQLTAQGVDMAAADPRLRECLDAALLLVDGDVGRLDDPATAPQDPAALVAVTVLARAGRAVLAGQADDTCCAVNPLHGPAVGRHHVRVAAQGPHRRMLPVCVECKDIAVGEPRTVPSLLLRLPGQTAPYYEGEGPLSAVPQGIARLAGAVLSERAAT